MLPRLLLPALVLALVGCAAQPAASVHTTNPASSTLQGDASRPAQAKWVRTELYFSVGLIDGGPGSVSPARWREFLDQEVTARFPDGFTAFDAYGQWRDHGAAQPERLATKVIVVLHEDNTQNNANIEAIRLAYKRITGDLSVLRLSQPADVSF
jgi:non-canonical (house-cleaning) NTP pyrophosphatase